jgi:hypothetical protein
MSAAEESSHGNEGRRSAGSLGIRGTRTPRRDVRLRAGIQMPVIRQVPTSLEPASAAPLVADLGFLASSDFPDRPGPAYLLVAMREAPTLHHYDPESVEYWVTDSGRGARRTLTRESPLPFDTDFSWGLIRIVDRLHVTNEYLAFGGQLSAASVDGAVIAVFSSPAPLLRRGGHSQGWDKGAEALGVYFSRFLLAVDYAPGFEGRAAQADPVARYAAFLVDVMARYRASQLLRAGQADLWTLLQAEERRLRAHHPGEWAAGEVLRHDATW